MISAIRLAFEQNAHDLTHTLQHLHDQTLMFQPAEGTNHIAWHVGHLVYSFQAIGEEINIPHWLSSEWLELFGQGSRPCSVRECYPAKAALLEAFADGKRRILERLDVMSPADMNAPLPDQRYRHTFPTVGSALLHTLVAHFQYHHGCINSLKTVARLVDSQVKKPHGSKTPTTFSYRIPFETCEWECPMPGVRHKTVEQDGLRLRLVEYSPSMPPHWCEKGHTGYLIEGELEIDFQNETVVYHAGDGIFLPDGPQHKHRGRVRTGKAQVFFLETT